MYFVYKYDDKRLVAVSNFLRSKSKSRMDSRSLDFNNTYPPDHEGRPSESGFGNDFAPSFVGDGNDIFNRENTSSGSIFGRAVVNNPSLQSPREKERRLKADDRSSHQSLEHDNDTPFGIATDDIYGSRRQSGRRGSYVEQQNPAFQRKRDNL
jgi:hypothetical protein